MSRSRRVRRGPTGSVRDIIERFQAGELDLLEEPNASADAGKKRKG
ncbi:MAG: hypothetical protein R6V19_16295 [Armatimonadota bacterium]